MTAGELEIVDITPPADASVEGSGADPNPAAEPGRRASSPGGRWTEPGRWVWAGGLLLLTAAVLSLLAARGDAWSSTTTTGAVQFVHTDLSGDTVVTRVDQVARVVTTRLDGWGQYSVTTTTADSVGSDVTPGGPGPMLGLGFVFGALGLLIAGAVLVGSLRWTSLRRATVPAAAAAGALVVGISIAEILSVVGARAAFLHLGPSTAGAVDQHRFHFGNSLFLDLLASLFAIAGAVVIILTSSSAPSDTHV